MITQLNQNLSIPSKAESSDHLPKRNHAYRSRKRAGGVSGALLATQVITSLETEKTEQYTSQPREFIDWYKLR